MRPRRTLAGVLAERVPPHDLAVERALLGCAILEGPTVAARLFARARPDDFFLDRHQVIAAHLQRLADHEALDVVLLVGALRASDELDLVGGEAALSVLLDEACLPSGLDRYLAVLLRHAGNRDLIDAYLDGLATAYSEGSAPSMHAEIFGETVAHIVERTDPDGRHAPPRATVAPLDEALARTVAGLAKPQEAGIETPFPGLNVLLLGGFLPGELVYLGARPGAGKTALALTLATRAGVQEIPTLVVSAEMREEALCRRILAQRAKVDGGRLRRHILGDDEWRRINREVLALRGLPVHVSDSAFTLGAVTRLVRALKATPSGLRFLVVDYLQLLQGPTERRSDRRAEVEAVSSGLKRLALRYDLTVLCLSSLSRSRDQKGNIRRPTLADLRESGELEHDADWVLFLYQPDETLPPRELTVAKGRDGWTGTVHLDYVGHLLTFHERTDRVAPDDEGPGF